MGNSKSALVMGPLRLVGRVQEYSWGKIGDESRISRFISGYRRDTPLAEYWLGAHSKAPSEIELGDGSKRTLDGVISQFSAEIFGSIRGGDVKQNLPFLVKVLSINSKWGLSIQVHPDLERARVLHAKDPANYPDASHKPEIGVAITPVTLLYGCKSLAHIQELVSQLPVFRDVIGKERAARLESASSQDEGGVSLVKECFTTCLSLSHQTTAELSRRVEEQSQDLKAFAEEREVFMRLKESHGDSDQGLLALFLMNLVKVEPGGGIFIGPNIPHAYLDGDLFECMACSDNVVRAGLTSKFKDVGTLSEIVDCSSGIEGLVSPRVEPSGFLHFDTPTSEFSLRLLPHGTRKALIAGSRGPGILLALGESASITSISTGRQIHLRDGGGVLFPAESGDYEVTTVKAAAYYVTTP